VFVGTLMGCGAIETKTTPSYSVSLNQNWQFTRVDSKNTELTDQVWQSVNLPHTPKIEPMVVNDQWQGIAWYQKYKK
jgi:beta-galactosidase